MTSEKPKLPALDPATVPAVTGTRYPAPFREPVAAREKRALGDALGLTNFGVNVTRLPPGTASSQRHWHSHEDEFVYVLEGELVLITDAGEQTLGPGMAAGFPAGRPDGHQLVNRSEADAVVLEVGDRQAEEAVDYPDIDMKLTKSGGGFTFLHRDGTPYD